jgi:TRAP transporter 4TM/12TM fusion protein
VARLDEGRDEKGGKRMTDRAALADPASKADQAVDPSHRMPEEVAFRRLSSGPAILVSVVTVAMVVVVLNQLLNLQFFSGITLLENQYLFILAAAFIPIAYLCYPPGPAQLDRPVPWYDWAMAIAGALIPAYFAYTGKINLLQGWEYAAPPHTRWLCVIFWIISLEALRRTGGITLAVIVFFISLYPTIAASVPGPIRASERPFLDTMAFHMFSVESGFGIPMRAFGEIVVGFILFGIALNYTGGGKFFNDIAFALVGRLRGGAAQVGVISSMLQGSISGSVISNVISSGVVTIPAMKRTGFSSAYAGGVEAVASTGAVLMPPVMGSTAFVMASFLGRPYGEIALAAAIPGLLFYFGLAIQIDAYAAQRRLAGMGKHELISLSAALREGWPYILVFALLIYLLLDERRERMAPFWATLVMLAINQFLSSRMNWRTFADFMVATGRGLAELVSILVGAGYIIGAFTMTGLAGTLANDLVFMAGGAPFVLLVMGAITSFIFGMGMTVTACYIFLAIILAPALIKQGMDPMAVHLFILYWGMVSFITPPVALAAFAAAPIARVSQWSIGFASMRLGTVIYFVPFLFVYNPELLLKGQTVDIVLTIATSFVGILFLASGLQGYVIGGGKAVGPTGWLARLSLLAGGLFCALSGIPQIGLSHAASSGIGIALGLAAILLLRATGAERSRAI